MSLTEASKRIHWSLGGRGLLGNVEVQLPEHWTPQDCGQDLGTSHHIGVSISFSRSGMRWTCLLRPLYVSEAIC